MTTCLNKVLTFGCVLLLGLTSRSVLRAADGEKSLLAKYQKKHQKTKEQLKSEIQEVLKKAKLLERTSPEQALALVRNARDALIDNQSFPLEEEKQLYRPLVDRIAALKDALQNRRLDRMTHDVTENTNSVTHWSTQLDEAQLSGVRAYQLGTDGATAPRNPPALIAFRNGTYSFCLLRVWPHQSVDCTVDGGEKIFLPSEVLGVKIQSGYYLFHEKLGRFIYVTNPQAFMLTADTRLVPAQTQLPSPTPISLIPKGSASVKPETVDNYVKMVFVRGVKNLPMYFDKEKGFTGEVGDAMRAARDALIDAQLKKYLPRAAEDSRQKLRRVITDALNSQPGSPLSDRVQEQLLAEMESSTRNAGPWPQLLLDFINNLVQPNPAPRHS